jgi:putative transposase
MVDGSLPGLEWLRKRLEDAEPDLLRGMMRMVVTALMGAEADEPCGATYGARSPERVNRRNGHRERPWGTRLGAVPLQIPKLRRGACFPDWLLEPRRRAERAVVQVVAGSYLRGVSVRRVEGLVQALGVDRLPKSRVSELAKELDELVAALRSRPLDGGPYA